MALPSGNRELLKHFKVLKFLGKGSYGSVYKVKRISDERIYAVKETDVKSMSQTEREESVNEIRLLASASHPNIVSYNEAFLDGNRLCIVMEYAPNGDMSRIIKKQATARKPLDEMQIWKYFIQIARGINALHEMRVLHRDIKPGNIMVADGDVLKIGDLGIAKLLKSSMAKTQIGTPHYMPPEVWKSRPYAFPSDVWALGCILYEMATFNVPFEARSMSELRYKILRGRYSPVGRQYSADLIDMVRRLLDAVPENRPTLKQILSSETVKKMEAKIRMEANVPVSGDNQMLATIQVPRNLNLLKGKFPTPQYQAEEEAGKENAAPMNMGLPAIKEVVPQQPRAAARAPSAGRARSAAPEPPRDLRRAPSRGEREQAQRARAPVAAPPGAALQPRGASRNGAPPAYGQPPSYAQYGGAQYGRRAGPQPPNSRGGQSQYEAQRMKVAPPARGAPAYPGAPAGVSRVGSRAGAKPSPYADYGRPAAYPPAYMQRQVGAVRR